ncbi:ADI_G0005400.mRNA.1.CDS.1 [Saccharomyces cerevisiae]|nr:AGA_1a_G0004910.mRNA.1.CDS.1 [Saccharomyces cerevisiae]CAI4296801.1 ADI_G0005400.mRNA.1.CDS.1 [Saccharomyces cerevisiae]CAI6511877.1 AGA_1a_G0004910.mRNA.1.CDS.1 [Saccharomyces cerevisiae]CAI6516952.1 ADI_G0005400.mRNA.1.CDS.1 [Saccharomyces cerevisiae]
MAYAHGCYSIYYSQTYPAITFHSAPWPISLTKSVLNAPTSLFTALASAVYTLCHLRITPTIIHILIFISYLAVPNIV